jgi:hypothetical protein
MSKRNKNRTSRQPKPATRRPLWLALAGLLLLLLAALALWSRQPAPTVDQPGDPQLVVDRELIDFGEVRLGETVTASFTLTNTGTGTVRFHEAPYIEVVEGC